MHRTVRLQPSTTPVTNAVRPPPVRVTNTPPHAAMVSMMVRRRWLDQDRESSSRRKIGNRPNISMEKSVKEKTCVVDGSLEASTADAIIAEFVDMDVGNLCYRLVIAYRTKSKQYSLCTRTPTVIEEGNIDQEQPRA
jgi:hypothetical protein